MNKIILITLGILIIIGISYQVKHTHDSSHDLGINNPKGESQNKENTTGAKGLENGTSAGQNGTLANGGKPGSPTSATGSTPGANVGPDGAPIAAAPEKPKDNCFSFEYRHKRAARDQDIENFLDYTNAFTLQHANFNEKSLCVKVNQKPVNYQVAKFKSTSEVRIGSMVGPESVIRVSYCVGKVAQCQENCVQPKKRFMDDLMNDASDEDSFSDSWGKGENENPKKELKNRTKELRAIASENDHLNEASVQRDWEELQKHEWVCR